MAAPSPSRAENLNIDTHYAALEADARPGPYVLIEVEDTGVGMPQEVLEKIFNPFLYHQGCRPRHWSRTFDFALHREKPRRLYSRLQRARSGDEIQDLPARQIRKHHPLRVKRPSWKCRTATASSCS